MNSQITPEQVQNLLTLGSVILLAVVLRLIGLAVWRKWFADDTADDGLTQEERDLRMVYRKGRRPR
ncbi:hypothetical protein FDG2_4193 [Candidatus Protofrankia californiensis]|uniref:Uncharacterized protein n=1 Tax=Candidatus Protofrankia californiensis TaxID=1839754 RepID=A0A1C3P3W8_9ACTN|nr:hypothetical protein FDG2_4193 [Candidatus Protofrankia californiensis]